MSRGEIVVEGPPDELKRGLRGEAVTVELADGQGAEATAIVAAVDPVRARRKACGWSR